MQIRRNVILGLFIAGACVLHIIESWIPLPLPVPGAKLGLANTVSLAVLVLFGWREAMQVAVIRVFLGSIFGGSFLGPSFAMSMGGAVISVLVMGRVMKRWHPPLSLIGVSVAGAAAHNIGQLIAASAVVSSLSLLWYLPYLLLLAVPTGIATGAAAAGLAAKVSAAAIFDTQDRNSWKIN